MSASDSIQLIAQVVSIGCKQVQCFVVALILEEIAIDSPHNETEMRLLDEAQELHLSSLMLAMKAFGENNVQTAKHYGNLGRLYQSMHKFEVRQMP